MPRREHIEAIERRPWTAADALRANSNYASNEYFLTQFADRKAHDGGEFFTPISLVSLIANVLEPDSGTVLDPARGPGVWLYRGENGKYLELVAGYYRLMLDEGAGCCA